MSGSIRRPLNSPLTLCSFWPAPALPRAMHSPRAQSPRSGGMSARSPRGQIQAMPPWSQVQVRPDGIRPHTALTLC